jgi:hypothetical protein
MARRLVFELDERELSLPTGDAARLGLHLAVFGREEEMPRSRRLAEKIATGVSLAERGEVARLRLRDSQRRDLHAALDAMIDERDGSLTRPLLRLRSACAPIDHGF